MFGFGKLPRNQFAGGSALLVDATQVARIVETLAPSPRAGFAAKSEPFDTNWLRSWGVSGTLLELRAELSVLILERCSKQCGTMRR